MQKKKSLNPWLLLAAGFLAAPACSLPALKATDGGGILPQTCAQNATDAGAVDAVSTVIATGDVENVVTPQACVASPTGNAIDKYSQGYSYADPAILMQVDQTMAGISVHDEQIQMSGMPYGSSTQPQYTDIQRSQDTDTIRGFRYRDASRGMNLGEDIDQTFATADVSTARVSAIRPPFLSAWRAARPSISISSTRSAKRSATRCRPPSRRCCSPPA